MALIALVKVSRLSRRLADLELQLKLAERRQPEERIPEPPIPEPESPIFVPEPQHPTPKTQDLLPQDLPPQHLSLRERFGLEGQEWEAVIGGSWLNKLGVAVMVIGLALFVSYSLAHLGAAGRVGLGIAAGAAMVAGGVVLERRPKYLIYARGLLGGGWAALYFTTYAAHALDAARVIHSPVLATALLIAVSAGMVGHALRYRSEWVAGMAYFLAFVALAIAPVTTFCVVASLPLAASLLYVSLRFGWDRIAAAGLVATYSVYLINAAHSHGGSLAAGESVLVIYWLLFEAFDLRGRPGRFLPYLNACGFVLVSVAQWSAASHHTLWGAYAIGAALYTARAWWNRGYRFASALASALCAIALLLRFSGWQLTAALLAEAEIVFVLGVVSKRPFLRRLSEVVFLAPIARLLLHHIPEDRVVLFAGRYWQSWTGLGAAAGALFYLNRLWMAESLRFGYAAAAAVTVLIGWEVPRQWWGPAWLAVAWLLFELGRRPAWSDFRKQAYIAGIPAIAALVVCNVLGPFERPQWLPQLIGAALAYAAGWRRVHRDVVSSAGSAVTAALLWNVLPAPLVAPAWAAQGLILSELGIPTFRNQGHALQALAFGRLFLANFTGSGHTGPVSHRLLTVLPVVAIHYYQHSRFRSLRVYSWSAAVLAAVLMRFELGRTGTVDGWALYALGLLVWGWRRGEPDFRLQSYLLSLGAFIRSWTTNFYAPDLASRILTALIVIACFYGGEFLSPRDITERSWADRHARMLFSVLASTLLAVLLYYEVSGSLLTVAWGLEGAVLLAAGFPLRERTLRVAGLALFLLCILKLFFYDLRALETPYRILSFMVLGGLLLAISWVYTQFRERIRRLL